MDCVRADTPDKQFGCPRGHTASDMHVADRRHIVRPRADVLGEARLIVVLPCRFSSCASLPESLRVAGGYATELQDGEFQ